MRGIVNILIGIGLIIGGLSGELVLVGTQSGGALALVGAGLAGYGVLTLVRGRSQG